MAPLRVLTTLLTALIISICKADEDFAFDLTDDLEVEFASPVVGLTSFSNKPNIIANVGRTFHLVLNKDIFGKGVKSYQARVDDNKHLPGWLLFDKTDGAFYGVPLEKDEGVLNISVKSIGQSSIKHDFRIIVREQTTEDENVQDICPPDEAHTILVLLLDRSINVIKPLQRVVGIHNIAKFFGLPHSAFKLTPQIESDNINDKSVILAGPGNLHSPASKAISELQVIVGCDGRLWLKTAPIIHQLKQQARDGTISEVLQIPLIGWRVKSKAQLRSRSRRQAVVDDLGSGDYEYYEEENYDDDYDEDAIVENAEPHTPVTESTSRGSTPPITTQPSTTSSTTTTEIHPHRHHHGELKPVVNEEDVIPTVKIPEVHQAHYPSSTVKSTQSTMEEKVATLNGTTAVIKKDPDSTTTSTTTSTTIATTEFDLTTEKFSIPPPDKALDSENNYEDEYDDNEEDIDGDDIESETVIPETTTKKQALYKDTIEIDTEPDSIETTTKIKLTTSNILTSISEDTVPVQATIEAKELTTTMENTEPISTTTTASAASTSTTSVATLSSSSKATSAITTTSTPITTTSTIVTEQTDLEEATFKQTTVRQVSSPKTTTTIAYTEGIEYEVKNFPPTIQNRLKRIAVTAGKMFSYVIPENTFTDMEDGYNVSLEFLDSESKPVRKDSWCQFNERKREIYGLPLEEDVSRWEYVIKATDKEGASVSDRVEILVQQHKSRRVVNHEFSLYLRIEKHQEFPHNIDWPLKVLRDLSRLYHSNASQITVRHVNYTSDPVVFTWTNDSLPTNYCPDREIVHLYQKLTANDRGDPSFALNLALAPELRVKNVVRQDLGVCEPQPKPPLTPPTNFPPILRNPVDELNATVGELLIYQVPDDTFYDPEDVDPRMLNISLLMADRQPIPSDNWLQFDSKNREFFGIPKKPGRTEYHLECRDSGGLSATDSLNLVVHSAPKLEYNVEIWTKVETEYNVFINSAQLQRKFIENLQKIFGDKNSSLIHLGRIEESNKFTIIRWYNKTLTGDSCPHKQIEHLKSILRHTDVNSKVTSSIHQRINMLMGPELPVSAVQIIPQHRCKEKPKHHKPIPTEKPGMKEESTTQTNSEEYFVTIVVPAVIISIMLFVAGIAACVLYRRRRTGKMNVEEDGRSNYGNKGIPVIFQEELDEKPESGTKTPVILKDEKPPLAPPEYSKSGGSLKLNDDSEPYQPPPPFTRTQDSGRQTRPKPTPTYRKPPPYVPP